MERNTNLAWVGLDSKLPEPTGDRGIYMYRNNYGQRVYTRDGVYKIVNGVLRLGFARNLPRDREWKVTTQNLNDDGALK